MMIISIVYDFGTFAMFFYIGDCNSSFPET